MNTYDEVIKYLKSYQESKYNAEFYRNKMGGLKAIAYSQEEKGTAQDNMMSTYMQKIDDSEKRMLEIETFIECNFVGAERLAIWNRYVNCMQNKEVCACLNLSNGYAHQYIKKAIMKYIEKHIQQSS